MWCVRLDGRREGPRPQAGWIITEKEGRLVKAPERRKESLEWETPNLLIGASGEDFRAKKAPPKRGLNDGKRLPLRLDYTGETFAA